jgi:glutamine transport system substrate-binding protein
MKRRPLIATMIASMVTVNVASAEQKKILVGVEASDKPFVFMHNGKYTGFSYDLWVVLAKEIGIKFKIQAMNFSALIPALQTNNIDVAFASIFITPLRKEAVDFSDPYYMDSNGVLVRSGSSIVSIKDISGKKIATLTGSAQVAWARENLPTADQTQFPNITDGFFALQAGRVDAILYDYPSLAYYAENEGKGKVRLLAERAGALIPCGFAFPKGSPLVDLTNKALKKIRADGQYSVLSKKWFGQNAS